VGISRALPLPFFGNARHFELGIGFFDHPAPNSSIRVDSPPHWGTTFGFPRSLHLCSRSLGLLSLPGFKVIARRIPMEGYGLYPARYSVRDRWFTRNRTYDRRDFLTTVLDEDSYIYFLPHGLLFLDTISVQGRI